MHALGFLLLAIAKVLKMVINIYTLVVAIAVLISWVNPDPYNPIVRMLHQLTEPVFGRVRRLLPPSFFRSGLDFTPILVIILLMVLDTVAVSLLFEWSQILVSK